MTRIDKIRARVVQSAQRESAVGGGKLRIPGMKIGTQMSAGGPTYEDVVWLCDTVDMMVGFMKSATYVEERDMHMAMKLVSEAGR